MAHYDIPFGHGLQGNQMQQSQANWLVRVASGDLYFFFIPQDLRLYYAKSIDSGVVWGTPVVVYNVVATNMVGVWYDRWTDAASGDVIHIAFCETGTDDIHYRSLTVTTDTLGSDVVVFAGTSVVTATGDCMLSITKARGGNLYIGFDMDGGAETGFYRSTDSGATWGARTDLNEVTSDYYVLVPGFAADNQDIMAIYWDRSADEISRKVYDDSANSWAETSIAGTMADVNSLTDGQQLGIATDLANSRIFLAAWSGRDTVNADLRFWHVSESAITEQTNVVLNSGDDQAMCTVALETDTGDIYVFYGGKSDGSEEATGTSVLNIYYKVSTDDGATWGAETKLNTSPVAQYTFLTCTPRFTGGNYGVLYTRTFSTVEDAPIVSVPSVFPEAGDVRDGVTYAGFTGTLTLPAEAQVEDGVTYGAGGTEFEGTLVAGGGGSIVSQIVKVASIGTY
jgi:hypothetical protein